MQDPAARFPVDARICEIMAGKLMEVLAQNSVLAVPGVSRGDNTREKLTWTLAGYNTCRRGWHPAFSTDCPLTGIIMRKADRVSTSLDLLPAHVSFGVPVVIDGWKELCQLITKGSLPQPVLLLCG